MIHVEFRFDMPSKNHFLIFHRRNRINRTLLSPNTWNTWIYKWQILKSLFTIWLLSQMQPQTVYTSCQVDTRTQLTTMWCLTRKRLMRSRTNFATSTNWERWANNRQKWTIWPLFYWRRTLFIQFNCERTTTGTWTRICNFAAFSAPEWMILTANTWRGGLHARKTWSDITSSI